MSVFIIAEAGVNHNGSLERALAMVDAARDAKADAIKFQTFSAEKLASPDAEKATYQKAATGSGNQVDMLRALELSEAEHRTIQKRCEARGIEFMSTPFDEDAADFLVGLGMGRLKVPSGEIVNHDLLRHLARMNRPIILSTGMATMDEIQEAVAVIRETRAAFGFTEGLASILTVLHCTSSYPAALGDVNLRAMTTIATETGLPVGYSDHTLGTTVAVSAVALGATVIEKHFTLDRSLDGPDHQASLTVEDLAMMVGAIREVEQALGSATKAPTNTELAVRAVARRSVAAARDLRAGEVLSLDDLVLLRPAAGIEPKFRQVIVGRALSAPVRAHQAITWNDLAES